MAEDGQNNISDKELINRVNSYIRDLKREIKTNMNQVNNISFDAGVFRNGIITDKQLAEFKRRIAEIKQSMKDIDSAVSRAEKSYNAKVERYQKIDKQYREQTKNLSGKTNTPESYKVLSTERDKLAKELQRLSESMNKLRQARNYNENIGNETKKYEDNINNMHKERPMLKRAVNTLTKMVMSEFTVNNPNELIAYMKSGANSIRRSDDLANTVGQKIGYGELNGDRDLFKEARKVGEANQFNSAETLSTQKRLIRGGYEEGNTQALLQDTYSTQSMMRAYSMDDSTLVGNYNQLKKMGSFSDGEMHKFSTMIAGAIDKTKMRGREEELVRSVSSLVTKVGDQLPTVSSEKAYETVGLQTLLGSSVSSLNGERGSSLLSSMDSAIKGGGNTMDILLGKGSEYVGVQGMYALEKQKEQGLTIDNLKSTLQQSRRIYGGDNSASRLALKSAFNGSLNISQIEALTESGFFDKILSSDSSMFTEESINQLNELGLTDLANQLETYGKSETKDTNHMYTQDSKIKQKASSLYEGASKKISNAIHGLPDWMQVLGIYGTGMGIHKYLANGKFGNISRKAYETINKTVFPNVGGTGGIGGKISSSLSSVGAKYNNVNSSLTKMTGVKNILPSTSNAPVGFMAKWGDDLLGYGAKATGTLGKASTAGGNFFKGASKALGSAGKVMPIVGGVIDYAVDRAQNPNTNKGRSASKAVGSTLGGLAGGAIAAGAMAALGIATGGIAPLLIGAAGAIGGSLLGSSVGDKVYSGFNGDSDKTPVPQQSVQTSPQSGGVAKLEVGALYVNGQNIAQSNYASKKNDLNNQYETYSQQRLNPMSPYIDGTNNSNNKDSNINIKISGNIDGMSKDNEDAVKKSVTSYFNSYTPPSKNGGRNLLYESYIR